MNLSNRQQAPASVLTLSGRIDGKRVSSRLLEDAILKAVSSGARHLNVEAYGQHGIGGRMWHAGNDPVRVRIFGHPGQRVGAMGFPNTLIEVMGPASDDLGWLNAGARIVVHGNAGNGAANAMAQGKIFVAGSIGARGMTMTKHNPRFDPPEMWVLGSAGDYFGEFMAGGVAVICGYGAQTPANVLGYRPLVGMVGGKVFFRGPHQGFSRTDARMVPIGDEEWHWLSGNLADFLKGIGRTELYDRLADRTQWQLLTARPPRGKFVRPMRSMAAFHSEVWEAHLGPGGLIGDLTLIDRSPIPLITVGRLRRFVPVWENRKYTPPCEAACPTGIPVQRRWQLIRDGRLDEAVDLALAYTPFPASVCGYLCPNLCMQSCSRQISSMAPVDVTRLGKASLDASLPELPPLGEKKIAVIGGGAAGLSVAWQLRQKGHRATVYEILDTLGGKFTRMIPQSRIPPEVVFREVDRVAKVIPHVYLRQPLDADDFFALREENDFVVVAIGAQKSKRLAVPGSEKALPAVEFLASGRDATVTPGGRVVVIGAGNVGCDVATEAYRLGAKEVLLLDVQEPAAFGKEREAAESAGARFRWPAVTREIVDQGVVLTTGEVIPADTVVAAIGEVPDMDFLSTAVETADGFVRVDAFYRTSDPRVFAIGDVVRPGLLTDAIGAGRKVAQAICDVFDGKAPTVDTHEMIDYRRMSLEYFDPRITAYQDITHCGSQCSSCGACRDCGICEAVCPQAAIARQDLGGGDYEYVVNEKLCIACGFCAGACPCGVWNLLENAALETGDH
jgi:NADPH-dependent glutamate synthase beta subunit-like oxidoreductase/glutamate synthase domain-containing protein 3/NAD-dependent dihydropyrimidine dehydrogenase PreA subunit